MVIYCPNCKSIMFRTKNDDLDVHLTYVDIEWKCENCEMVVSQRYDLNFAYAIPEGINQHSNLQDGKL